MFELAEDEERRMWVALIGGKDEGDDDYRKLVTVLERMGDVSPAVGESSVLILCVVPDSVRPPAMWRLRFAEAERHGHGKRVAFAVVTDSAVLRGIRVAVSWLSPPPPGYETTSVATYDEAVEWVEKHRSGVAPALRLLGDKATSRARQSGKFRAAHL
jgi:hypothetical protein